MPVVPGTLVAHQKGSHVIPVIDVFAGPGGLNEGFSQLRDASGRQVFDVRGSFEMEPRAVETLTLRAAYRRFSEDTAGQELYVRFLQGELPQSALEDQFPSAFADARRHIHQTRLGEDTRDSSDEDIRIGLDGTGKDFVLIGGPPCQAYSLVGRARRKHDVLFEEDEKHFLFREYLHILEEFQPAVFVMENVKGLLSATHSGIGMFERIREDLELEGTYQIYSLVVETDDPRPEDFVIRAEEYGVPQKRHRVILLGVRDGLRAPEVLRRSDPVALRDALDGMPALESVLTENHTPARWRFQRDIGLAAARERLEQLGTGTTRATASGPSETARKCLRSGLNIGAVPVSQHSSRRHMGLDVARYAFYSLMLKEAGRRPKVFELPQGLKPAHRNVQGVGTPFSDRFWVQPWDEQSSTIVSHLSKDGHHFIHPDPMQARSLSVREAARLQTFPDDYWFCGPRTAQFQQVGNAVPPLLAKQIARVVSQILT